MVLHLPTSCLLQFLNSRDMCEFGSTSCSFSYGNVEKLPIVSKVVDKNKDKTVKSVLNLRNKAQHEMASLVHPHTLDFVLGSWRSQAEQNVNLACGI